MKKLYCITLLLSLMAFVCFGCARSNELTPEEVIKNYFSAINDKNAQELDMLTGDGALDENIENIKSIKLISIKEVNDKTAKYNYFQGKLISEKELEKIKTYKVNLEIEFIDLSITTLENGKYTWDFILVNGEGNNWFIQTCGY